MKQASLFDDDGAARGGIVPALGVNGSGHTLTKEQKRFNKAIAGIDAMRRELARWQEYVLGYQRRVAAEFTPLIAMLREKRIAMAMLLDRAMSGKTLNKTQKAKVEDILMGQLSELLAEAQAPELVQLYNKYSDVRFEDMQQDDMEFARAFAADAFGVELDESAGANTPEDLARLIAEEAFAAETGRDSKPERKRKKSAKAIAQEAMREQAAQGASKAVREIFRKLASELHPDREPDLEQRARKTVLMQQVNQAYAAGDLLALLELQLSIEQIDPAALANMTQERLGHYILVLEEQSQKLREELSEVTAPFVMAMGGRAPRQLTPEAVERALDADIRELQMALRGLEADLVHFQDIGKLKSSLKHYRIEDAASDDIDLLERLFFEHVRGTRGD